MALGSESFCLTRRALHVSWGNASLHGKLHGTTFDVDSASPAELERLIRAIDQDTNESEANLEGGEAGQCGWLMPSGVCFITTLHIASTSEKPP